MQSIASASSHVPKTDLPSTQKETMQNQSSTCSLDREFDHADRLLNLQAMTSNPNTVVDLESELSAYVRWALRKTSSGEYSSDKSMRLLEKAWKAQKALWQLRKQEFYTATVNSKLVDRDRAHH